MTDRAAFAGGDQDYLRNVQYGSTQNLVTRSSLHLDYATNDISLSAFEAALLDWPAEAAVLDCGCGTGVFWEQPALARSLRLTLTDLSPAMVAAAERRATDAGYTRVNGQACDVQSLPFGDSAFDVVVANHVLHHAPDPDRGVAELARVVAPAGAVLISANAHGHMDAINAALAEVFDGYESQLYDVFGLDSGERLLRRHFASVAWHAYDNDLDIDDVEAAAAYAMSFPPGEHASPEQAVALRTALARRTVDGRLRVRTRCGVFVARSPRC